jgi:hypothetical protein
VARGAFKISDNESPAPRDRVFATYDYFNGLNAGFRVPGIPGTDLHREVIGFEKTFLKGDASVGMRLPVLQVTGDPSLARSDLGDLAIILKFAWLRDPKTGSVLSSGLVVTAPTGSNFLAAGTPDIHPATLQPFVGALYVSGKVYFQGFSSLLVPTDSQDVTYLFNDLAVGYFLYRDSARDSVLTSVTPTVELHVNTPLNHQGSFAMPIPGLDIVDVTAGVWLGLCNRAIFGLSGVVPVTGPRAFNYQVSAQLNVTF